MIEFTTAALLVFSSFYGSVNTSESSGLNHISTPATSSEIQKELENVTSRSVSASVVAHAPLTLEEYVREYYSDAPILAEVARCESTFRHFGSDGRVIRGIVNKDDVGVMQINEYYHKDKSESLGFDILSFEGNLGYAKWLYESKGTGPWVHSSKCWKKYEQVAAK